MDSIRVYLEQAVREKASDLFLVAGKSICMKVDGEIRALTEDRLMPDGSETLVRELYGLAADLVRVETLRQAEWWFECYMQWCEFWADFLEEWS